MPDPSTAAPRPDLAFLRHRSRPRPERVAAVSDFIAGRGPHPGHPHEAPPAPAPAPAPAPTPSSPLNLSDQSTPSISFDRPGRKAGSSLDLSDEPAPAASPQSTAGPTTRPPASAVRPIGGARVRAGQHHLLSVADPTVLLTRIQSGVGTLDIEAACSPDIGDLRIGAAYELRSGHTSTVQLASNGNRFAPSSRRPVIVAGRESGSDQFETLRLDLRQIRDLRRAAVYAFSESRAELNWGGTLVIRTAGGARVEMPLENLYRGRTAVLVSLYSVDGELVVWAEMETVAGDVREAARAYGYDRITWRDERTPVEP